MPLNFFPQYSQTSLDERVELLACYASGAYTSQDSDAYTFLKLSSSLIEKHNKGELWQQMLIKALCRVNR